MLFSAAIQSGRCLKKIPVLLSLSAADAGIDLINMDDWSLIQRYVGGDEAAFGELVNRYVNLVYSAARRQVENDSLAEEVTQAAFILLARKASSLSSGTVLAGWLYRTTRFLAQRAIRGEQRRLRREQEAFAMQQQSNEPDEGWKRIAPILDEAVAGLRETDRNAILLRFFHGKTFHETALALGMSEDATKKRVTRSLEKLRTFFAARGFTLSATALAGLLASHSAKAAPTSVASGAKAAALSGGAISGLALGALRATQWTVIKTLALTLAVTCMLTFVGWKLLPGATAPSANIQLAKTSSPLSAKMAASKTNRDSSRVETSTTAIATNMIRFQVVDAATGEGIARAQIAVRTWPGNFAGNIEIQRGLSTDQNGFCLIDKSKAGGRIDVDVVAEGWVQKFFTWWPERFGPYPSEYTLALERAAKIGGTVMDEGGRPIAGAAVSLYFPGRGESTTREPQKERLGSACETPVARTGIDGYWSCSLVPSNDVSYSISIEHPEFQENSFPVFDEHSTNPNTKDTVKLDDLVAGTARFTLKVQNFFVGRVINEQGEPIANARVCDGDYGTTCANAANGEFKVKATGNALTASAPGYSPSIVTARIGEPIDITLKPGNLLIIRVTDQNGVGLPHATVALEEWNGKRSLDWRKSTDEEGRIVWKDGPPATDQLSFYAHHSGYMQSRNNKAKANGSEHVIKLRPEIKVSGRVIDSDTKLPISQFKVIPGFGYDANWNRMETAQGTNGSYKIAINEDEAAFWLRFEAPGYEYFKSEPIKNNRTYDVEMTKTKTGDAVAGTVLLPNGEPAVGAELALCTLDQQTGATIGDGKFRRGENDIFTKADADGKFSFKAARGAHTVVAIHRDGFARMRINSTSLTIQLQPWGRIEGRVGYSMPKQDELLAFVSDWASAQYRGGIYFNDKSLRSKVSADGNFVIDRVPPGLFFVGLKSGENSAEFGLEPVAIHPGRTTNIELGTRGSIVTGKLAAGDVVGITDWKRQVQQRARLFSTARRSPLQTPPGLSEEAAEMWKVDFWQSDAAVARLLDGSSFPIIVNSDGTFFAAGVAPGTYQVNISVFQSEAWKAPMLGSVHETVTVPASSTGPIDVGTLTIRKTSRAAAR